MTGPTGTGKSALAAQIAEHIGGEVVGADAFQIYSGLPILTSQPGEGLLRQAPHHLVGVLDLFDSCDAARYLSLARPAIQDIRSRGKTPVLCGGTGMYLKALTHGLAPIPPPGPALRLAISQMSLPEALARLEEADPLAPGQIDAKNPVRVRRALEIVLSTGRPLSESRTSWKSEGENFRGIVLTWGREDLRQRIAGNVEAMFAAGVVEEVRTASHAGSAASRAIGFREIQDLLASRLSLPDCRAAIVSATCRYAKRQLTWCRHQFTFPHIALTPTTPPSQILQAALEILVGERA